MQYGFKAKPSRHLHDANDALLAQIKSAQQASWNPSKIQK
jgi:hypothetical protein